MLRRGYSYRRESDVGQIFISYQRDVEHVSPPCSAAWPARRWNATRCRSAAATTSCPRRRPRDAGRMTPAGTGDVPDQQLQN
ncbi:hypothetical protein [Catenuloplanes indicus]|uniref:hypothetical protein n=1 Tax=Catenuloplanes indicus TaxID=137267 RepID=UPI0035218FCF